MPNKDVDIPRQEPVPTSNFGKKSTASVPRVPTDKEATRYLNDDDGNKLQGQEENEDMDILELEDEADLDDERLMSSGKTFEDETLWTHNESNDEDALELEEDEAQDKILADKSRENRH